MNPEKYNRRISLICSTCGGSCFNHETDENEAVDVMTCSLCQRVFTRDELLQENGENIHKHIEEVKKEIFHDVTEKIRGIFKKNKVMKIK